MDQLAEDSSKHLRGTLGLPSIINVTAETVRSGVVVVVVCNAELCEKESTLTRGTREREILHSA